VDALGERLLQEPAAGKPLSLVQDDATDTFRAQDHYALNLFAGIHCLLAHIDRLSGVGGESVEQHFSRYPFLREYHRQILLVMPASLSWPDGRQWWRANLRAIAGQSGNHLPLEALDGQLRFRHETIMALMLAGLVEEDSRFGTLFADLQQPLGYRRPMLETLGQVVAAEDAVTQLSSWDVCSPLLTTRLVQADDTRLPRSEWVLKVDPVLWDLIRTGQPEVSGQRLKYLSHQQLTPMDGVIVEHEFQQRLKGVPSLFRQGRARILVLRAPEGSHSVEVSGAVAQALGKNLVVQGPGPEKPEADETLGISCTLLNAMPVYKLDLAPGETAHLPALAGYDGPIIVILGKEGGLDTAEAGQLINLTMPAPDYHQRFGHVCLDVLAPGAKEEEKETVCSNQDDQAAGTLSWTKNLLTADPPVDTSGKWRATIRPMSGGAPFGLVNLVDYVPDAVEFPVFLTIMAEDSNVGSDYSIGVDDYVPGSEIPLHVKLKESGKALVGGVSVSALVASPDQSIGDLLAASSAGTSQPGNCPGGCDTDTDADTKLANELSENEEALARVENTVTLLDNGNSENGDQVAGDGIYSALYQVDAPGHYNVLFKTSGTTERSGDVMREQLMSLVVRNQPDADKTDIDTHISSDPKSRRQILNMTFKPATKGGHLMGPGWANYFWFTGPEITPFKATDNLDGTYSVAVSFYGWKIPDLTLHFLDVAQAIEDSTTHDKLPAPLGDSTALSDVTEQPPCKWYDLTCGMARLKYLILIILVLLIVFLLFRKHSGN
jgi:hypothetical protein